MTRFKKRKFFKKHQDYNDPTEVENPETEKSEVTFEESYTVEQNSSITDRIKSTTKYAYILAISALLSGIFTPFILDESVAGTNPILGILSILVGVVGGILIFKGTAKEESSSILILSGLALAAVSLVLIFYLSDQFSYG